jgi:shikimate dehydrogenase
MPGSGKTTIGTLLAEKLGRPFIDTDDLIVKKAGCAISDIFRLQGEAEFRRIETETVKEISSNSGCVIATGGGAVLNTENMYALKMNGRVYFLDRSPELLAPTSDRPLALSKEAIFNRYRERYDIYCRTADEIVDDNSAVAYAAQEIERRHFK